jgi:hypothetical protein
MKPALIRTSFAEAVFARISRLRERNPQPKQPWSDDWESFLDESRLQTAEDAAEARRVALLLSQDGLLELRLRRDQERIQRFAVPLPSERDWFVAFGRIHPADLPDERTDLASVQWNSKLQFLPGSRVNVVLEDLLKLNAFLSVQSASGPVIPIKERSLQIFGDEKRLDDLLSSALFRPDRLDAKRDLHCESIGVPLAWKRGPSSALAQPLIVIENAATWHSYCRWNVEQKLFSGVVYGDGNRFVDGIRYLPDIFSELNGPRRVLYFGDLDPQGLRIPQEASNRLLAAGLPSVEPHLWSYRHLLALGDGHGQPCEDELVSSTLCDWLVDCAQPVLQLFASGKRLAQEHIGWDFLQSQTGST